MMMFIAGFITCAAIVGGLMVWAAKSAIQEYHNSMEWWK